MLIIPVTVSKWYSTMDLFYNGISRGFIVTYLGQHCCKWKVYFQFNRIFSWFKMYLMKIPLAQSTPTFMSTFCCHWWHVIVFQHVLSTPFTPLTALLLHPFYIYRNIENCATHSPHWIGWQCIYNCESVGITTDWTVHMRPITTGAFALENVIKIECLWNFWYIQYAQKILYSTTKP